MFALLPAACGTAPAPTSPDPGQPALTCALTAHGPFAAGGPVDIDFELVNHTDRPMQALTWNTPLEGILNEIFTVTRDGEELPYRGIMVKRAEPTADSYVAIAAGERVSRTVDVAKAYDLSVPGNYTIVFRGTIHDCIQDGQAAPRIGGPRNRLELPCAPIAFRVVPS